MMLSRKTNRAIMKMVQPDSHEMKTAVKVATAGFIAYHAVKFMVREIMD